MKLIKLSKQYPFTINQIITLRSLCEDEEELQFTLKFCKGLDYEEIYYALSRGIIRKSLAYQKHKVKTNLSKVKEEFIKEIKKMFCKQGLIK